MKKQRNGLSPETAFLALDSSGEMTVNIGDKLDKLFGGTDGSYFVHSETTMVDKKTNKRFKTLYVEDSTGVKHTVYFEIA